MYVALHEGDRCAKDIGEPPFSVVVYAKSFGASTDRSAVDASTLPTDHASSDATGRGSRQRGGRAIGEPR